MSLVSKLGSYGETQLSCSQTNAWENLQRTYYSVYHRSKSGIRNTKTVNLLFLSNHTDWNFRCIHSLDWIKRFNKKESFLLSCMKSRHKAQLGLLHEKALEIIMAIPQCSSFFQPNLYKRAAFFLILLQDQIGTCHRLHLIISLLSTKAFGRLQIRRRISHALWCCITIWSAADLIIKSFCRMPKTLDWVLWPL